MFCCVGAPAVAFDSPPYPKALGKGAPTSGAGLPTKPAPPTSPQGPKAVHCEASALQLHEVYPGSLPHPSHGTEPQVALQGTDYAAMCRRLLNAVESLRNAGASAVLNLPQVVVAGNQSAGKSSVIEAICGISLPRSEGTCTRCPTEVCMSDAPSAMGGWSASVRVRREWDDHGARLPVPELTGVRLGITDPREVEAAVRAAQDLLLALDTRSTPSGGAPGVPGGSTSARRPSCAFSRNSVVVEVQGAPASLALVDLPGIIHATESPAGPGPGVDYPGLVAGLVREYAGRPSSVLVAVLSCKEDLDTQGILSLARELDPAGQRTLGVLTKPDAIEEACHAGWLAVLQGKRWPLRLGYYMVLNPSQAQLNSAISHAAARGAEAAFFARPPWSQLAHGGMPGVASKLGITNLRRQLAKQLAELTAASMPHLLADAQQQLTSVDAQLAALPEPLLPVAPKGGRPAAETELLLNRAMAGLLEDVCSAVAALMSQHSTWQALTSSSQPAAAAATAAATPSAPPLPAAAASGSTPAAGGAVMAAPGSMWAKLMADFTTFRQAVLATRPTYDVNGTVFTPGGDSSCPASHGAAAPMPAASAPAPCPAAMSLGDVHGLVESHRAMELPGFSPYSALQALVARSTAGWGGAAEQLLAATTRSVADGVMAVLSERLARFPAAARAARAAAHGLVSSMAAATAQQVRMVVTMECGAAFTMNRGEFESQSSSMLQQLREAASRGGSDAAAAGGGGAAGRGGRQPQQQQQPQGALRSLSSEHELTMLAVSLTYFQLASRRVVDYVPMTILHHLVDRFGVELKTVLASDLLAGKSTAAVAALLAEDEGVAAARHQLHQQRLTLQAALDVIAAAAR